MSPRIDLNDIRLLMEVVEHGSFTAASKACGVSKSTLSQRISVLEGMVGASLGRRTSRKFCLTDDGARMVTHGRAIEDLARQVEKSLFERGRELSGTLKIACSNVLAQYALSSIVPKFLALHKQAAIRVEASNDLVDLVSDGYDMIVRAHCGSLKDSTLVQRVVARTTWMPAASPGWIEKNGLPLSPEDVQSASLLCFSTTEQCSEWQFERGTDRRFVAVAPRLISDDMAALKSSAVADGGIAYLPAYLLWRELAEGQLVRILSDWSGQVSAISVLTPPKAQSSRLAGAFSNFLAAELPRLTDA